MLMTRTPCRGQQATGDRERERERPKANERESQSARTSNVSLLQGHIIARQTVYELCCPLPNPDLLNNLVLLTKSIVLELRAFASLRFASPLQPSTCTHTLAIVAELAWILLGVPPAWCTHRLYTITSTSGLLYTPGVRSHDPQIVCECVDNDLWLASTDYVGMCGSMGWVCLRRPQIMCQSVDTKCGFASTTLSQ